MRNSAYISIIIILSFLAQASLLAQSEGKRELRATWVASVANIDWPEGNDRNNPDAQKADLISKLELYKSLNMNAIFLQVRPECDALYQSAYEPWSRYLTLTQGDDPGYDPLQFAIDEAHKRGIEVHAWMNPYRISASTSPGSDYFHSSHVYKEHPEWAIEYSSGRLILNPGLPEVMSYIGAVVKDLCSNYTIDGVHFDDYFYAYEGTSSSLDAAEYALYGNGMTLSDWRRDNVNRMVDTVYANIQAANSNIRFGVSPFGIYKPGIPSGIVGMDAYNQIYCDPMAWLEDKTVDYLTPQMYWPTGGGQDFESLVNWWSQQCLDNDRHLYPGQASYRLSDDPGLKKSFVSDLHERKAYIDLIPDKSGNWLDLSSLEISRKKSTSDPVAAWTISQIGLQIDIIRSRNAENALGSVFFSAKDFERVNGLADYLSKNKYTHPTVMPEMTWKDGITPNSPTNIRFEIIDDQYILKFDYSAEPNDRFIIYAASDELSVHDIISNPDNIKAISFEKNISLSEIDLSMTEAIVISTVSATGKESLPEQKFIPDNLNPYVELVSPENKAAISQNSDLLWSGLTTGSLFKLQISSNLKFSNIIYESSWISQETLNIANLNLDGETNYFWRIKAKTDIEGIWSEKREFSAKWPIKPQLISPENLAQNVNTFLKIDWTATPATEFIVIEISKTNDFASLEINESLSSSEGFGIISNELEKAIWYYLRIKAKNAYGLSIYTKSIIFKTTPGVIPKVELLSPADNANLSSFEKLTWRISTNEEGTSYQLDAAIDQDFKSIMSSTGWINESEITTSLLNLEGQRDYYWKVKAKNASGESEYSDYRKFTAAYPTRPSITSPGHLSEGNDVMSTLAWTNDNKTDSMYFEFSTEGNFSKINYSECLIADPNTSNISASLHEYTWYFVRVAAKNDYGLSVFSASKYFKTDKTNSIYPEKSPLSSVIIYPNPSYNEDISIIINNDRSKALSFYIYDCYGKNIFSSDNLKKTQTSDFEYKLKKDIFKTEGIYFIKILQGKEIDVKSFIVIK